MAIEIPDGFAAVATDPVPELIARFCVSRSTVKKWRKQLGLKVPVGAPKGNTNGGRRRREIYGQDGPEQIRACLNCTAVRCTGSCVKVR